VPNTPTPAANSPTDPSHQRPAPAGTAGRHQPRAAAVLMWAMLAVDAPDRRRTWCGLAGFVALEAATFTRYTDVVILAVAALATTRPGPAPPPPG
jgi:hypothetical protein